MVKIRSMQLKFKYGKTLSNDKEQLFGARKDRVRHRDKENLFRRKPPEVCIRGQRLLADPHFLADCSLEGVLFALI